MNKIKEVRIDGERVFLKKSFGNYRVVFPYKIDGKVNLRNLIAGSSWFNLIKVLLFVGIVLGCVYEYSNALKIANQCLNQSQIFLP